LRGAIDNVAATYRIQVGLEYAAQDKDLQPIILDVSVKSVDVVLNQLVNQKPDYVWSFVDNVYDIYPNTSLLRVFAALAFCVFSPSVCYWDRFG
jgi:hypothetical protein